jgi:hypothetical protein
MASAQAMLATQFGSVLLNPGIATNAPVGRATTSISKNGVLNPKQAQSTQSKTKLRNPELTCLNPNCGRHGHTIEKCWRKGGGQEGKGPKNIPSAITEADTAKPKLESNSEMPDQSAAIAVA